MAITEFGKAVRKARIDAENVSLASMAAELDTSPSFLSALEMGRKKIPSEWVAKIAAFFAARGISLPRLGEMADVANKNVSLDGLTPSQQMLVAGFARVNLDEAELKKFAELLASSKGSS